MISWPNPPSPQVDLSKVPQHILDQLPPGAVVTGFSRRRLTEELAFTKHLASDYGYSGDVYSAVTVTERPPSGTLSSMVVMAIMS